MLRWTFRHETRGRCLPGPNGKDPRTWRCWQRLPAAVEWNLQCFLPGRERVQQRVGCCVWRRSAKGASSHCSPRRAGPQAPGRLRIPSFTALDQNIKDLQASLEEPAKASSDLTAWFSLFADLDPLSNPHAVGKTDKENMNRSVHESAASVWEGAQEWLQINTPGGGMDIRRHQYAVLTFTCHFNKMKGSEALFIIKKLINGNFNYQSFFV